MDTKFDVGSRVVTPSGGETGRAMGICLCVF